MKPPLREWLICWESNRYCKPIEGIPFYFAYYDEEDGKGFWMVSIDESMSEECDEPKNWRPIPK